MKMKSKKMVLYFFNSQILFSIVWEEDTKNIQEKQEEDDVK